MDDSTRRVLTDLIGRHREEIVDRGTDWVWDGSVDLGPSRSRAQTRALVDKVVTTQTTALLDGDRRPLEEFIDFVTTFRAEGEFHASTLLRGMMSFRTGLVELLRREVADPVAMTKLLAEIDDVAQHAIYRAADLYTEKLNHTIVRRREELEEELAMLTAAKERELDEKIRTIEEQRATMNALSSPVIHVWHGILVVPLIGEIGPERAESVRERVLGEVVASKSGTVLVDITGLALTSEQLGAELVRLFSAVRLLGAEAMLVGVSAQGAIALAQIDDRITATRSFATLHDGLRAAFLRTGVRVVRTNGA